MFSNQLSEDTWDLIGESRQVVKDLVCKGKCIYGINTGFGQFATVVIAPDQLEFLFL